MDMKKLSFKILAFKSYNPKELTYDQWFWLANQE
jgi:hypothetical protein